MAPRCWRGWPKRSRPINGFVSLVGAGPGDPGLLTLAGKRALERADVVLYDRLASPALLATVPVAGQERIHVGKTAGPGHVQQSEITALLLRRAKAGQRVARLKGGDPFVLGRGGEEALACAREGIGFEVIPGVTSAIAAAAYAGIPVTHREFASGFSVLTGHERADGAFERVDWSAVAGRSGTLVVLMGVLQVARWSDGLIAGGVAPQTPVALIRWATTPRQETLQTTLGEVAAAVAASGFRPPAVAIVGDVVTLRERLAWREARPLFGKTVALTRSRDGWSASDQLLEDRLADAGAHVVHLPLTRQEAVPPADDAGATPALDGFSDVMFTSANGVRFFAETLFDGDQDSRALAGKLVWAVGPATARALQHALGVRADYVATPHSATGLVETARRAALDWPNRKVLFPAAEAARPTLAAGLRGLGADVTQWPLYRTAPEPGLPAQVQDALDSGLNLVTLASPSAVDALADALAELGVAVDSAEAPQIAAIGPTTAARAAERGLTVAVVPPEATLPALAEALVSAYSEPRTSV